MVHEQFTTVEGQKPQNLQEDTSTSTKDTVTNATKDVKTDNNVKSNSKSVSIKKQGYFEIFIKGLWKENPGLCQLLGLCPLLAVSSSAINALGLALATIIVMVLSSIIISILRKLILKEVRIPLYVVLIATLVTIVSFEIQAYYPNLYESLGIYLSLIVTNCIIMGRAEAFAGRHDPIRAAVDALSCGIGFGLVLFALGSIREIIGAGTFLAGASSLFGTYGQNLEVILFDAKYTYLIAILPPGGFFALAFLIAIKNFLDNRKKIKNENKYKIKSLNI